MQVNGVRKTLADIPAHVYGKTIAEIKEEYDLDNIAKLCFNENPYGPYPCTVKAVQEEINNFNQYPDTDYKQLKKIIGRKHGLGPQNVALSHGIVGMLETISKMFIENGDEVIIPEATFGLYQNISKIMGAKIVNSKVRAGKIDVNDILNKISDSTSLIWLANPNNPTGTVLDNSEFQMLINNIPEETWLIFDEAYYEFADRENYPKSTTAITNNNNIIITRTFSKACGMAGFRLGYALARSEVMQVIKKVSQPFNANKAALAGARAVLESDIYPEKAVNKIKKSRNYLSSELTDMGCQVFPSSTNFVFFETPYPAAEITEKLLQRGIMASDGSSWNYEKGIRISIGKPEQNKKFISELKEIIGPAGRPSPPPRQQKQHS